jgi:hypothetical protein
MGDPNKYADGLEYIMFPGNYGLCVPGYNFPESTAVDEGTAGAVSLSFLGSKIPQYDGSNLSYGYGPSGGSAYHTPLAMLNDDYYYDWVDDAWKLVSDVNPTSPNLMSLYLVNGDEAIENTYSASEKAKTAFNSISEINVLDLISEGPIEGLVTGLYIYSFTGKVAGDIGYSDARFEQFSNEINSTVTPEARSIFWNDTPIADTKGYKNFQFAKYKFTYGEKTNDHTIFNPYINIYEDRYNYFGQRVDINKYPIQSSVTKAINESLYGFYVVSGNREIYNQKTYYVYNTDISSIKINIKINALLEQIVTGSNLGDIERQSLNLRFGVYRVLSDGQLSLIDTSKLPPFEKSYWAIDDIRINGKVQKSPMIATYEISLRPFAENKPYFPLVPNQIGWAIDIMKLTREFGTPTLSNSTSIDSITEVYSDRFTYPDTAMMYSKFDARFFNDLPNRSYKLRLLKVKIPINYDPIKKTYSGAWNGQFKVAWTDNPAWCFYDLITSNRFGLGKYINSNLADKWNLYEISKYCDQLVDDGTGGLEPRFTTNVYISSKEEAYKVLNDMASIFLGILYYSAGQIIVNQDSKKDPIYLFNNSNVINGDFSYSDASKKSRKTVALVRYNNKYDNFKPALEYIEDRESLLKYGIRETEIAAFGCTSKTQARRLGKWLLLTQNTETELIDFKVGFEGNFLRPGDVISIYDGNRKNAVYAGRTLELNTGYAILDTPYNLINTNAITGAVSGLTFNVLTPTYNLNQGTQLGDSYITGFAGNITSDGVTGLNSSFFRRSQIQSVEISPSKNYLTSGSGIYSNNIRINFPSGLNGSGYLLAQNTVWTMDINTQNYSTAGIDTFSRLNESYTLYPGYYLESFLNEPKSYRVLGVTEESPEIFNINALEYNLSKFGEIDGISTLQEANARPNAPTIPSLRLSGIFRDASQNYLINPSIPSLGLYTTNQNGINSIMYNIIPPARSSNQAYYVYVKSGSNFTQDTPASNLIDILYENNFQTGVVIYNNNDVALPPFFTPLYTGTFFFRVFAENSIRERSTPATGVFTLRNQAADFYVSISGINVF